MNDAVLTNAIQIPKDFSGTIHIQSDGITLFQAARGYANRSDNILNRMDTRYSLASVSKAFTAVALLQLVEEGWLRLEDDIREVLPETTFPKWDRPVTVHELLTHTSALPDYFDESEDGDYENLWMNKPVYNMRRAADFLPMYQNKPMKAERQGEFHYNNAGFLVLAMIIEHFSGKSFIEAVSERVFQKAGMKRSGYFSMDNLPSRCSTGYRENGTAWVSNIFDIPPVGGGDGGAWSTAGDLMLFWDAFQNNILLGPTMTARMVKKQVDVSEDDCIGYGYGLWLKDIGHTTAWYLQGCDPGASVSILMDPTKNIRFAVLSNTSGGVWDVSAEICRRITEGTL